jgi:5-methylcytosine-specific restriction endonuclease McrA
MRGKDHYNWQGGISKNSYPNYWTETLRRSIRERDCRTCQICGKIQEDYDFDIHHIDYDKNNGDPRNLITLCRNCHLKTNGKDKNRNYWLNYFKERI